MAYPDEFLQFAQEMASLYPNEAHQPSLRRAVFTAYYALFHLLISEAVSSCVDPPFRAVFARFFEHGLMKGASDRKTSEIKSLFKQRPPQGHERVVKFHLHNVVETFSQAQQNRNDADSNLYRQWQPGQVSLFVESVADALDWQVASWNSLDKRIQPS